MAQFIEFLPRQALVGNSSGGSSATITTQVFDVSGYNKLDLVMQAFTASGTGVSTGEIEHTDNPCMSGFVGATGSVVLSGVDSSIYSGISVKRFIRGKVTVPVSCAMMLCLRGRAYDG